MRFEVIDNHSVDADRLGSSGWVLDAGSRGLDFSREMVRRGMRVIAMDPDPEAWMTFPEFGEKIKGVCAALVGIGQQGRHEFARWDNGQSNRIITEATPKPDRAEQITVNAFNIIEVMHRYGVDQQWACVKLNCEGAEYEILKTWPGPIADQISVSFHDHTGANPRGEETYREIFAHLGQWYDAHQHVWESRYCAGNSYWDTVFTLKEGF